jgi:hypothetical protein
MRALKVGGTLVVFAVLVPVFVVLAAIVGLEPTHWSGVRLDYVEVPPLSQHFNVAPEWANTLLDASRTMDGSDTGDVAPSYWDPDAGRVVLAAVTDRGVAMRRALGDSGGVAYRVDRRRHSAHELRTIMDDVLP